MQFWSEIILEISNRIRAARSFDFKITRMISDQIALHSIELPSFIPFLLETVVVKLVEASHSNERAKSNPKRIKYLRGGRSPYAGIAQLLEVRL